MDPAQDMKDQQRNEIPFSCSIHHNDKFRLFLFLSIQKGRNVCLAVTALTVTFSNTSHLHERRQEQFRLKIRGQDKISN